MCIPVQGKIPFRSSSFFTIAWQMLCVDFVGLVTQVLLVVPETWAGEQLYPNGWVFLIGAANTMSYNAELLLALLLTLNRLCIFAAPKLDRVFFTRPRIFV